MKVSVCNSTTADENTWTVRAAVFYIFETQIIQ